MYNFYYDVGEKVWCLNHLKFNRHNECGNILSRHRYQNKKSYKVSHLFRNRTYPESFFVNYGNPIYDTI